MKLFALCIGATVAASLVAVQSIEEGPPAAAIQSAPIEFCDGGGGGWAVGSECTEDADCSFAEGNNLNTFDLPVDRFAGVCCATGFNEEKCANVDCPFDFEPPVCKHCYFPFIPIPPSGPGCCPNSCCREGFPLIDAIFGEGGVFEGNGDGANFLDAWQTVTNSGNDIFLSPEIEYCPYTRTGLLTQTLEIALGPEDPVLEYNCIDLCCSCCNNLAVSVLNPETPAHEATCLTPATFARPGDVHNFRGPIQICSRDDPNRHVVLFSHDLGIIGQDMDGSAISNHRISIGCSVKQDGGNPGNQCFNTSQCSDHNGHRDPPTPPTNGPTML